MRAVRQASRPRPSGLDAGPARSCPALVLGGVRPGGPPSARPEAARPGESHGGAPARRDSLARPAVSAAWRLARARARLPGCRTRRGSPRSAQPVKAARPVLGAAWQSRGWLAPAARPQFAPRSASMSSVDGRQRKTGRPERVWAFAHDGPENADRREPGRDRQAEGDHDRHGDREAVRRAALTANPAGPLRYSGPFMTSRDSLILRTPSLTPLIMTKGRMRGLENRYRVRRSSPRVSRIQLGSSANRCSR